MYSLSIERTMWLSSLVVFVSVVQSSIVTYPNLMKMHAAIELGSV